jgi:hypothetical protein
MVELPPLARWALTLTLSDVPIGVILCSRHGQTVRETADAIKVVVEIPVRFRSVRQLGRHVMSEHVRLTFEVWKDPRGSDIILSGHGVILNVSPSREPRTYLQLLGVLGAAQQGGEGS